MNYLLKIRLKNLPQLIIPEQQSAAKAYCNHGISYFSEYICLFGGFNIFRNSPKFIQNCPLTKMFGFHDISGCGQTAPLM